MRQGAELADLLLASEMMAGTFHRRSLTESKTLRIGAAFCLCCLCCKFSVCKLEVWLLNFYFISSLGCGCAAFRFFDFQYFHWFSNSIVLGFSSRSQHRRWCYFLILGGNQPRVRVIEKIQHKPLVSTLHWWTNRFQYFDSILCWKIETICVVFFNTACVVFFNTAKPWNLILGVLNILFFACRYCLISALVRHLLYFLQSLALFQGCPWPGLLHFSITATIFPEYTLWKDSINR